MFAVVLAAFFAAAPQIQRNVQCLDERFLDNAGTFAAATPRAGASLIRADAGCLDGDVADCRDRVPIDPSHQWIAGKRTGHSVCVTDGRLFGWIEASKLSFAPLPSPPKKAWIGRWEFAESGGEPWIQIRQRRDGKLHVWGYAEWRAHADSTPHLGEIDFTGLPRGIVFDDGDPACFELKWTDDEPQRCFDCVIRLMLLGDRLLGKDNGRCGGMNVNFTATYAHPKH